MRVAFRVDASLDMGTGHVMRCLTLAEALRENGAACHFICRPHPGNLSDLISKRDFPLDVLDDCKNHDQEMPEGDEKLPSHASWLGCDWTVDAQQTAEIFSNQKPDWLVVDHYALDRAWESMLRNHVGKIMVIDDLADRSHNCDLLLDQNLGRKESDYRVLVPQHTQILVGPKYALLRPEFAEARTNLKPRTGVVSRVLVFFGGTDPDNVTEQVLKALSVAELIHLEVDVVLGIGNPHRNSVLRQIHKRHRTTLHVQVSNMAQLMASADLFVGAIGSTTWERCAVGLPGVCIAIAANQIAVSRFLQEHELVICLDYGDSLSENWQNAIRNLLEDQHMISEMSLRLSSLVDTRGAARVVDWMMK